MNVTELFWQCISLLFSVVCLHGGSVTSSRFTFQPSPLLPASTERGCLTVDLGRFMWMPEVSKRAALPPGIVPAMTFSSSSQDRATPDPDTSRMDKFGPGFAFQSSKAGCCFVASDSSVVWVGGGQLQRSEKQYCRVTGKTRFPRRDVHAVASLSWKIFSVDVVRVKF